MLATTFMCIQFSLAWGIVLTGIGNLIEYSLDYIEQKTKQQ